MRQRWIVRSLMGLGAFCLMPALAFSGSPHFISCPPSVDGQQICVTGKEAGLGDEDQIHLVLTVVAHCQNRGGNDPSAQNKETFGAEFDEPVQNGKALYEVCVLADFTPECNPPMSVVVDAVTLVDTTNRISCSQASQ